MTGPRVLVGLTRSRMSGGAASLGGSAWHRGFGSLPSPA